VWSRRGDSKTSGASPCGFDSPLPAPSSYGKIRRYTPGDPRPVGHGLAHAADRGDSSPLACSIPPFPRPSRARTARPRVACLPSTTGSAVRGYPRDLCGSPGCTRRYTTRSHFAIHVVGHRHPADLERRREGLGRTFQVTGKICVRASRQFSRSPSVMRRLPGLGWPVARNSGLFKASALRQS